MAMLDWLRTDPRTPPTIEVGDRVLPVVVRRLAHARRMTLRLAPDGSEVRLSIPRWGRAQEAIAFARTRIGWLERQLAALPAMQPPGHGATIRFRGMALTIDHAPAGARTPRLGDGMIHVGGPAESLPARLRRWLEAEARAACTADLAFYCARIERVPPALALSNARRRWGSCAPDGAIRINWRLIMAPDLVRRSVVAHEVAHLVHFDHSERFHALLGDLFEGEVREANHWLKREGRLLYATFG
jgi:predicted metal-dependent hydrolase